MSPKQRFNPAPMSHPERLCEIRRVGTRSMSLKSMLSKRCYGQPDLPAAVSERHHVMDDEVRP
eukprot:scaffold2857_cov84-Skeletonema_menzelii.AAC.1